MKQKEICQIFRNIAKLLEIKGDNPFRIRAYERAAQNIEGQDLEPLIKEGRLKEIPGIGEDLSRKIEEFYRNGKVQFLEDLTKEIPAGLLELLRIPSLGPKTAKLLYQKLKIKDLAGLEKAIEKHSLEGLFGIKEKTIANISRGIEIFKHGKERMTLCQATTIGEEFLGALRKIPEAKHLELAGSLRRQKETVRDIDILVYSEKPQKVMDAFVSLPSVKEVLVKGPTKSSLRTEDDIQVDCRLVAKNSFGAALLYFTGSKNFNIKLRQLAIKRGLKINEYGVFKGGKFLKGETEKEIFRLLAMQYIEPELREDSGEIELALKNRLPLLLKTEDIKGDLHVHSKWSDGRNSIEEIANVAKRMGYRYIAITDHSQGLKVAHGVSLTDLKKKRAEIDKINRRLKGLRLLCGTEVDINASGRLDYSDAVLREFDIVIAAIHTGFKQSKEQLTKRSIAACKNKYVHILAHPTGRLWGVRPSYEIDFEELLKAAKDTNTALEINAFPQRLDLGDLYCRRAKEAKVRLAIGTDAHDTVQLQALRYGVSVARRGWLSKDDVLNTLSPEELLKNIKK